MTFSLAANKQLLLREALSFPGLSSVIGGFYISVHLCYSFRKMDYLSAAVQYNFAISKTKQVMKIIIGLITFIAAVSSVKAQLIPVARSANTIWADALWIDDNGYLWIPTGQLNRLAAFENGKGKVTFPVVIYKLKINAKPLRN